MITISSFPYPISMDELLCSLMVKGDPIPAARARVTRFGTYTPAAYRKYKQALSVYLKGALTPLSEDSFFHDLDPEDRVYGLRAFFYRHTFQRTDVDNLLKSVMDAGTAIIWPDDSQVTEVFGKVIRGSDDPRVEILIYEIEPEGLSTCRRCGKRFRPNSGNKAAKFCGNACRKDADQAKRQVGTCEQCGGSFTFLPCVVKFRPLRFCSRSCAIVSLQKKRRVNYSPKLCMDCGLRVSRPEYDRCRACQIIKRNSAYAYHFIEPEEPASLSEEAP